MAYAVIHGHRGLRGVRKNEVAHLRIDRLAPAPAAENAVMARALDLEVLALVGRHTGAQVERGARLSRARDIVEFAFHRENGAVGDVLRAHALGLSIDRLHIPRALDQRKVLEHGVDRLEVIRRVHVEHGVVLVIELAVRLGAGVVALEQVLEVVVMAGGMPVWIHGHEARVLQEAGIHAPARARVIGRHIVDHIGLEPLVAARGGEVVHRGGRTARIDGASHHGQRQRRGLAAAGHQRHRSQHRYRGLAYADHMATAILALQMANELLHVVHVVIKMEHALVHGNHARVFPVGDVHLVVRQHAAHGVAQQRCIVARQRRDDQHRGLREHGLQRIGFVGEALETTQLAERLVDFNALHDGHANAFDIHRGDAELRFLVVFPQPVEQLEAGRDALGQRRLAERRQRVAVEFRRCKCKVGERLNE